MICNPCLDGGRMNSYGHAQLARERHNACEYPDCYCQHRVGEGIKKPPRDIRAGA